MRNYLDEEFRVGDKVANIMTPYEPIGVVHDLYLTDDSAEACWVGDKVTGGEFLLDNLTKLKSIQIPQTPGNAS